MPASAADAMVKAVGDEVVRAIVTDHYRGIVPPAPRVDRLVQRFEARTLNIWLVSTYKRPPQIPLPR
jgi:hypothetical protein